MMSEPTYEKLERAARRLLVAMDRQHGSAPFSANVNDARRALRDLLPKAKEALDYAERISA